MDIKEAGNKFNRNKVLSAIADTIAENIETREAKIKECLDRHRYKIVGFFRKRVLKTDEEVTEYLEENDSWGFWDAKYYKARTNEYLGQLQKYVLVANYGENDVYLTPDQFKLIENKYTF